MSASEIRNYICTFVLLIAIQLFLGAMGLRYAKTLSLTIRRKCLMSASIVAIVSSIVLPLINCYVIFRGVFRGDTTFFAMLPEVFEEHLVPIALLPSILSVIDLVFYWSIATLFQRSENKSFVRSSFALLLLLLAAYGVERRVVVFRLLTNKNAWSSHDPQQLMELFNDVNKNLDRRLESMLPQLVQNSYSPPELLRAIYLKASDYRDPFKRNIYSDLVRNRNTPSDVLQSISKEFSQYQMPKVGLSGFQVALDERDIQSMLINPNMPLEALKTYLTYPNCKVRGTLIDSSHKSEILTEMSKTDSDLRLRQLATKALEKRNQNSECRSSMNQEEYKLFKTLKIQVTTADTSSAILAIVNQVETDKNYFELLIPIASSCYVTPEIGRKIYKIAQNLPLCQKSGVLKIFAMNPILPADVLDQLAQSDDLDVLENLAQNVNLSTHLIEKLSIYPDCEVRKNVLENPVVSEAIVSQLKSSDTDQSVQELAKTMLGNSYRRDQKWASLYRDLPNCQPTIDRIRSMNK